MTMQTDFDRVLTAWLVDERPSTAPAGLIDQVVNRVAVTNRRPGWLVLDGWTWRPALRLAAVIVLLLLALVTAVLIGSALLRDAEPPTVQGRFTLVAPLTAEGARQVVQLNDGRALLIGSSTDPNTGAEFGIAEIYDPATGRIERLAGQPILRSWIGQGAVRLTDGRVLVTGGDALTPEEEGDDQPAATEIIDPATGSITTVGEMVHPRYGHSATLLPDGRVLIAGGDIGGGIMQQNVPAEIFDPGTGTFRAIEPLQHHRLYHRATLLADGRVLLTGGLGDGVIMQAEVFDPATETFAGVGDMKQGRVDHSATLLDDGRVLIAGGSGVDARGIISDTALSSAELFDPATDAFSDGGSLTNDRSQHAATLLTDGRVLIVGGYNRDGSPRASELFDPGTGRFVRGADTLDPLGNVTAAVLRDGHVFVLGEGGPPELFDPSTSGLASPTPGPRNAGLAGSVTAIDGPAVQRYAHTATLLPDGRVLVIGGDVDDETHLDSAELYDPQTGRWSATGSLNQPRARHMATLLDDGRVLVAGGGAFQPSEAGGEYVQSDSAELYDPATGLFTPAGRMAVGRSASFGPGGAVQRPSVMRLPGGRELFTGAWTEPTIDVFDPLTNTFTGIRSGCAGNGVMLPDGRVLLGCERGPIFDPAIGRLVGVANPRVLRQAGTTLADGRIVLSDALGNEPLVFDPGQPPDNPAWANLDVLLRETVEGGLSIQTTTVLPDGRILVFARNPYDRHPLLRGFAAIFDPSDATFTEVASPAGRFAATATLLPDGRVLFVGKPDRSPDRTDPEPPAAELLDLGR